MYIDCLNHVYSYILTGNVVNELGFVLSRTFHPRASLLLHCASGWVAATLDFNVYNYF